MMIMVFLDDDDDDERGLLQFAMDFNGYTRHNSYNYNEFIIDYAE